MNHEITFQNLTLRSTGPHTREELCECLKAFVMLTGREAKFIYVPLSTYKKWTEWSADEKGTNDPNGPPNMDAIPKQIMGCELHVSAEFRLS